MSSVDVSNLKFKFSFALWSRLLLLLVDSIAAAEGSSALRQPEEVFSTLYTTYTRRNKSKILILISNSSIVKVKAI